MNAGDRKSLSTIRTEAGNILQNKIIPFWLEKSVDTQYGGYLTGFDAGGSPTEDTNKYIVTQARMVWGFSYLKSRCRPEYRAKMETAAARGAVFLMDCFWDGETGGFVWKTDRAGKVLDRGKLVYGQSFGLYALSEYYLMSRDTKALEYAEKTFDLLQKYAADTLNGGYYENMEADWSPSAGGKYAGDRKSLDIHMHLMEAFTTLYAAGGREIQRRKLQECIDLLMKYMINRDLGYGYNQFDREFRRIPAINIHRTWNAERETGELIEEPTDTTSYGHNVELSWLMKLALDTLKKEDAEYTRIMRKLLDHSLEYGYDYEYGGVYRDGVADQKVLVTDKEWWQNFEALVGYSNGYLCFGDVRYLTALEGTWAFVRDKFINAEVGESRQLLTRTGEALAANIGNPWKGIYHTGRALAETVERIDRILAKG
ncbi:MAG: AGE family epimerase/isomerase [Treponema sp.]|jgi:mannobiose 2-epimerase|nr:AGE family epimerase/isomerase [Treponema sp.]